MSNTHAATAKLRQEGVHDWQADWGSTDATNIAAALDAQVEATLALAYEQRTANLIAIWQTGDIESNGETFGILSEKRMTVWLEIAERLGFTP